MSSCTTTKLLKTTDLAKTQKKMYRLGKMIKSRFREKLKFIKSSRFSTSKVSESVISANDGLISDCITAATQEIQQSVALGNIVKAISSEIQTRFQKATVLTVRKISNVGIIIFMI